MKKYPWIDCLSAANMARASAGCSTQFAKMTSTQSVRAVSLFSAGNHEDESSLQKKTSQPLMSASTCQPKEEWISYVLFVSDM